MALARWPVRGAVAFVGRRAALGGRRATRTAPPCNTARPPPPLPPASAAPQQTLPPRRAAPTAMADDVSYQHRRVELETADDMRILIANIKASARSKIDVHLPVASAPAGEPDPLRVRVEEMVDDVRTHFPALPCPARPPAELQK